MVRGWQASRTRETSRLFPFKAILLSAGGNDLKNLFSDLFGKLGLQRAGLTSRISASDLEAWPRLPGSTCQPHRLPSGSAWEQARRFWRSGLEPFELGFEVRTISVPFAGATVAYSVWLKFIKDVAQYGPTEDLLGGAGDRFELEAADNASLANHPTQLVGHFPVDEDGIARWMWIETPEGPNSISTFPIAAEIIAVAGSPASRTPWSQTDNGYARRLPQCLLSQSQHMPSQESK